VYTFLLIFSPASDQHKSLFISCIVTLLHLEGIWKWSALQRGVFSSFPVEWIAELSHEQGKCLRKFTISMGCSEHSGVMFLSLTVTDAQVAEYSI